MTMDGKMTRREAMKAALGLAISCVSVGAIVSGPVTGKSLVVGHPGGWQLDPAVDPVTPIYFDGANAIPEGMITGVWIAPDFDTYPTFGRDNRWPSPSLVEK